MTAEPLSHAERALVEAACNGALSPAEQAALDHHLAENPALARYYCEVFQLHAELYFLASAQRARHALLAQIQPPPQASDAPAEVRANVWPARLLSRPADVRSHPFSFLMAAAVVTCLAWLSFITWLRPEGADARLARPAASVSNPAVRLARVSEAIDARWAEGRGAQVGQTLFDGQRLDLEAGWAEVIYANGTRVVLEAPATWELTAAAAGRLSHGRVAVRVPRGVERFELDTPHGRVIDLGTEFAVEVLRPGELQVHVFQGAVRVEPASLAAASPLAALELRAGEAVHFDAQAGRLAHVRSQTDRFVRAIKDVHQLYWHGDPAVVAPLYDTAQGVLAVCCQTVRQTGRARQIDFYGEEQGRWFTPLILAFDPHADCYRVTGVGASIVSTGAGRQTAGFQLLAGESQLEAGVHTLGFFSGRVRQDPAGKLLTVAHNPGAIAFDKTGLWRYASKVTWPEVQLEQDVPLISPNDKRSPTGRRYSIRLTIEASPRAARNAP